MQHLQLPDLTHRATVTADARSCAESLQPAVGPAKCCSNDQPSGQPAFHQALAATASASIWGDAANALSLPA